MVCVLVFFVRVHVRVRERAECLLVCAREYVLDEPGRGSAREGRCVCVREGGGRASQRILSARALCKRTSGTYTSRHTYTHQSTLTHRLRGRRAHTCAPVHTHTLAHHVHTYTQIQKHTNTHTQTHTHAHTHTHTHTHTPRYAPMCMYVDPWVLECTT